MRTPRYQVAVQVFFSVLFLALYTVAINTINATGDLDVVEGVLYIMTAGFVFDEVAKFWKGQCPWIFLSYSHPPLLETFIIHIPANTCLLTNTRFLHSSRSLLHWFLERLQ